MRHTYGMMRIRQGFGASSCMAALVVTIGLVATRAEAQTRAYVANTSANAVTVIDTSTNSVIGAVEVGTSPTKVVIANDASRVYVANIGSNSISVIDVATDLVTTIPVGDRPSSLALTESGDALYVKGAAGLVEVINTSTNAVEPLVDVGAAGGDLAVTPDGSRVYIAAGNIFVIDTATKALTSFLPEATAIPGVVNFAVSVAIAPDGKHAYVPVATHYYDLRGFSAGGGIAVVDTDANAVTHTIDLHSQPGSIAFTRDGSRAYAGITYFWADTLYGAAFFPARTVVTIDTATSRPIAWTDLGAGGSAWFLQNTPAALAVTPDRSGVYVSIPRISSVVAIDIAGEAANQPILVAPVPTGIAVAPDPSAATVPYAIQALNDSPEAPLPAHHDGPAVANVLANDRIGGAPAAIGNVTLSFVSSTSSGLTLNTDNGEVSIAAGAEAGTHALDYRICEVDIPDNCGSATVSVTVRPSFTIDAADDVATAYRGSGVGDVVANDSLNGAPTSLAAVALSVLSSSDPGVSLNAANGAVTIAADAAIGTHTLAYRLCEIASSSNCDDAVVTVSVIPFVIEAADDTATTPRTGGTAIASVLANDKLAGTPATLSRVMLSQLSSTSAGVTLNPLTGSVSVAPGTAAGAQSLVYRICERANEGNCSDATANVTVLPYVVSAAADYARASSKQASTAIASVLANDRIGSAPANTSNVTLSLISMTPFNSRIQLDLTDGSVDVSSKAGSGVYLLVYEICEKDTPSNCARATATIELSGRQ